MPMKTHLSIRPQFRHYRGDPVGHSVQDQRTRGIHHVYALAAGVCHYPRLLGQFLRRDGVRHHQEANGFQTALTGEPEVLDRDVGLGAVSGDATDRPAVALRLDDVFLGAYARQHQEGDLGIRRGLGGKLDQFLLRGFRESVVERGSAQTVAVSHLDDRDAGAVQRRHDSPHLVRGELMPLVVRAVTQRRIGDPHVPCGVEEDAVGAQELSAGVRTHFTKPLQIEVLWRFPRRPWSRPRS
ncbi:Uncharacterised protein [Mycobacteroides abscessus subsp. abscessus]|nr:Uncharacterised protein [Mycobacteroides abscessus subsp. abscessus]